jgi:hypothetical protein
MVDLAAATQLGHDETLATATEAIPPLTDDLVAYLDWCDDQDHPPAVDEGNGEETYLSVDYDDATGNMVVEGEPDGNIREGHYVESYGSDAGFPIRQGIPKFAAMRESQPFNMNIHPSFRNSIKDTWQLARWLMSSGLSASSRDEFLKLSIVSTSSRSWFRCADEDPEQRSPPLEN